MNTLKRLIAFFALLFAAMSGHAGAPWRPHIVVLSNPDHQHEPTIDQMSALLGRPLAVAYRYRRVTNGFVVALNGTEAEQVAKLSSVARVLADATVQLTRSPATAGVVPGPLRRVSPADIAVARGASLPDPIATLVGAPAVWDGSGTGALANHGEGVIVGVVSTGINGAHPAFASTGDDGYTHVNPLGQGVYLGDCAAEPGLCSDKLIGRWTFTAGTGGDGSNDDDTGEGTRAAGTAAGNRLFNVPLTGPSGQPADGLLTEVSGVAPHASLIAYKACTDSACALSDVILAFEQAALDGADVVIVSIGFGDATGPWQDFASLIVKTMRAAGTLVMVSVGSSGPAEGVVRSPRNAPWIVSNATSSHGRTFGRVLDNYAGGVTTPLPISGAGLGLGAAGPVRYAGDVAHPTAPDPAQCLAPFPAGSFDGGIAVCVRGAIPFVTKAQHVLDGGADGLVIVNRQNDSAELIAVAGAPIMHIRYDDGVALLQWLSAGTGHSARMSDSTAINNPATADRLSVRNSRGPTIDRLDYLVPTVSAPAKAIFGPAIGAADAYTTADGVGSYASAGAYALVRAAHPDWSIADIVSALASSANADLIDDADNLPATPFEAGGGRIDVVRAINTGLVLDENDAGFSAADPDLGGEPAQLNLTALVELECALSCEWRRRVRATATGHWTADLGGQLAVTVTPWSFSLAAGESLELTVRVDSRRETRETILFDELILRPLGDGREPSLSATRLPIAIDVPLDADNDQVPDHLDNCSSASNPDQRDSNADGFGNLCDGDLNNDGWVNFADLALMKAVFGGTDADADLDGSGQVDLADVTLLKSGFLQPPGPGAIDFADG